MEKAKDEIWGGTQVGFESLDLMTEGIGKERLLQFVGETEMEDTGVVGILGTDHSEWQKGLYKTQICERTRLK